MNARLEDHAGRFTWRLAQPFGVEVEGDVSQPLTEAERQCLSALLYTHGFLVFRNQTLDKAQFRTFGGSVAPLLPEEHEANPVLAVDPDKGGFGRTELIFHRDLSYAEHPFQAIALHALEVEPGETSTYVASCTRAYRLLPEALKSRLSGLEVLTALGTDPTCRIRDDDLIHSPGWPSHVHKLVAPHPVTGAPVLQICAMSSVRIEGMSGDESEALLAELFSYVEDPGNVHEHKWYNGDLLIWDNFGALHARSDLTGVKTRTLQRLTLGKLSFPMAYPNFSMRKHTDTYRHADYMGRNSGGRF